MYSGLTENLYIWWCYVYRNRYSAEKLEVVQKYNHCLNCSQEGHSVVSCTSEKVYRLSDAMQSIVMICTLVKISQIFVELLFFSCFLDNFDA